MPGKAWIARGSATLQGILQASPVSQAASQPTGENPTNGEALLYT